VVVETLAEVVVLVVIELLMVVAVYQI